jgi:uncharacterized protein (DUF1800 family)
MLKKADTPWTIFEAAHLLNRAGFGGSPQRILEFHKLGREKAVDSLVEPAEAESALPPPAWSTPENALQAQRERIAAQRELQERTRTMEPEPADRARRAANQANQRMDRLQVTEAQAWWFRRMLVTEAPLREKMTLFWHDHFATSAQKVRQPVLLVRQNELFRRHAFGSFKELTAAIVVDPAMMFYLDTQNSRRGRPNENFAREVMELFTLGEGNYSEDDIRHAAKAFTGYQISRTTGQVTLNRRAWDDSQKTIFGERGRFTGNDVVNLIFKQRAASRFLPRKLWEFFVAENPSEETIDTLAESFMRSEFRIGPLLREIFLSREFYAEPVVRSQIKSPIQYLVQLLKQLEIEAPPPGFALPAQQQLGQVLFMPPNVAGWDGGKAWINTNTLLARYNLAGNLTKGTTSNGRQTTAARGARPAMEESPEMMETMEMTEMSESMEMMTDTVPAPGRGNRGRAGARGWSGPSYARIAPVKLRENAEELVDSLIFRFFQAPLPAKHRDSFIEYAVAKKPGGITEQEMGELCHLILSTPNYQLC